ncbi:MAG: C40 family peptidase [Haliscomenobacter sp.]|uniref:C40 family peptidase n=1 Tax=Haliscomenobacter sp. TaxID=2717303 RepID=UPI0029A82C12|nr:C40 family peptidase [Haliscomenobacter sp.]MDX2072105.1 C40 family peptidase [Haliscomenobacter sp.]
MATRRPTKFQIWMFKTKRLLFLLLLVWLAVRCNVLRDLTTDRPKDPVEKTGTDYSPVPPSVSSKEMMLRKDITSFAQTHLGITYKYAGKSPSTGFDCSGFTSFVMNKYGIKISASSRDQALQGSSVDVAKVKPGDLIFFRRSPSEPIFHVSLVVSNDSKGIQVVHSTTSRGVIVDNITASKYWKPYIDSAKDVVARK